MFSFTPLPSSSAHILSLSPPLLSPPSSAFIPLLPSPRRFAVNAGRGMYVGNSRVFLKAGQRSLMETFNDSLRFCLFGSFCLDSECGCNFVVLVCLIVPCPRRLPPISTSISSSPSINTLSSPPPLPQPLTLLSLSLLRVVLVLFLFLLYLLFLS